MTKQLNIKILLLLVLCLGVSAAVIVLSVYPWITESLQLRTEIEEKGELLSQVLEQKVQLVDGLSLAELEQAKGLLEGALPSFSKEWLLFATVEEIAAESNVSLGRLDLATGQGPRDQKKKKKLTLEEVSLPVVVEGELANIVVFMEKVEGAKRVMEFDTIDFGQSDRVLKLGATIKAPYYPLPDQLEDFDQPLEGLDEGDEAILEKVSQLELYGPTAVVEDSPVDETETGKDQPFSR